MQYTSREFFDLEVEKIWKRAWQMACHEDDMPNVGDYVPYDIAGMSFLVVRTGQDEFKAYYNACLHRGRKLRENRGGAGPPSSVALSTAGLGTSTAALRQVPCQWDYPGLKAQRAVAAGGPDRPLGTLHLHQPRPQLRAP